MEVTKLHCIVAGIKKLLSELIFHMLYLPEQFVGADSNWAKRKACFMVSVPVKVASAENSFQIARLPSLLQEQVLEQKVNHTVKRSKIDAKWCI